jgi:hypothetical protein
MDTLVRKFPAPSDVTSDAQNKRTKAIWCATQWTNLSLQAKNHRLPTLPYFVKETGLLSKEVNEMLWKQVVSAGEREITRVYIKLLAPLDTRYCQKKVHSHPLPPATLPCAVQGL